MLFSCKSTPDGIIDKKNMALIVADLQLAEAKVSRFNLRGVDSSRIAYSYLEKNIFKKYKIDSAKYVKSFDYYALDKSALLKIYSEAESILEKRKNKTP